MSDIVINDENVDAQFRRVAAALTATIEAADLIQGAMKDGTFGAINDGTRKKLNALCRKGSDVQTAVDTIIHTIGERLASDEQTGAGTVA